MDLFPKPLTRDEIIIIIEGLESRKDSILEYRNTRGYKSNPCTLSDIRISTIGGIITEDTEKKGFRIYFFFTCLLERFIKEKPEFLISIFIISV